MYEHLWANAIVNCESPLKKSWERPGDGGESDCKHDFEFEGPWKKSWRCHGGENLELRNTLPFHVKILQSRLVTENEDLKAEIQKLKDANEIALIRTSCADTPAADLRNMLNACKLRNVESLGDLAISIE